MDPPEKKEPDTKPDVARFICPQCKGEGEMTEETWINGHLHRALRQTCDVCIGDKWVTRDQREKYIVRKAGL